MSCCQTNQQCATSPETTRATQPARAFQPVVDIFETAGEWVILADLPGATRDQLDLGFEDGILTVRARVPARQTGETPYLIREYPVGDFQRTFRVGEGIDPARISAALESGVLTIRMPKSDTARPRKIDIQSN